MSQAAGDRWAGGGAYDAYMGRWSALVAGEFLDWLRAEPAGHWLEIGCGTGMLTASICSRSDPATVVATDQSAPFVEYARTGLQDPRVSHVAAAADALPSRTGGFDFVVSGLVLNFIPEAGAAVAAMSERARPGGTVAAYLWDYSGGVEFLHYFWEEAVAANPGAAALDESRRFGTWGPSYLTSLFERAGLIGVTTATLTIPTVFSTFDDFWRPFLGGAGPAPAYVASLAPPERELLAQRLRARLSPAGDASISLQARAYAVRGRRAGAP